MIKARAFGRGIGMTGNHFLVPMFNRFRRIFRCIAADPIEDLCVVVKTIRDFLKLVAIELKEREQMLVEANGFVIVSVEKGGAFSGQLVIGKANLQQAELLPGETGVAPKEASTGLAQPLPAT